MNIFIQPVSCRTKEVFLSDHLKSWGVLRGKNDINKKKFDKINIGDTVLFYQAKTLFAKAVISKKDFNENEEFECRYYFETTDELSINIIDFNSIVGYKDNYIPQGFLRLDDKKSKALLESNML